MKNFILKHLVAGGAGFLGSYIVEHLISDGQKVICLDNLVSGNKKNVEKWEKNPNFQFINHDVNIPINLEVDKVWHFCCSASAYFYQKDPIKTLNTCFNGTLNLLELAKKNKAKLLLTSSSEIYGSAEQYPIKEKYHGLVNPFGPRSCYAEGKRISESLCYAYKKKYSLNISIARIFNVFGPRMKPDDGRVISNFIRNALRKEKLYVSGNGNQTRSFCYIDDIVEGLIKLMDSDYSLPLNLGNPYEEYAIIDVAKLILEILDLNSDLEFISPVLDEPLRRKPNIELAREILKWDPKISFRDGLEKTISSFKFC